MTFAEKVLNHHFTLKPNLNLPGGVEWLYPYTDIKVQDAMNRFYRKFYSDNAPRIALVGINPGRFGAGITGLPFTDPIRMEDPCGLDNDFAKRQELSSVFVYDVIEAFGGPKSFYKSFYFTSVCPLGFVRNGKNFNYYDSAELTDAVMPMILDNLRKHIDFGTNTKVAFSMGRGKNFDFLKKLNLKHKLFREILPLPHPRWVMQYRLKRKEEFLNEYLLKLQAAID